jgi:hypothetical protein
VRGRRGPASDVTPARLVHEDPRRVAAVERPPDTPVDGLELVLRRDLANELDLLVDLPAESTALCERVSVGVCARHTHTHIHVHTSALHAFNGSHAVNAASGKQASAREKTRRTRRTLRSSRSCCR